MVLLIAVLLLLLKIIPSFPKKLFENLCRLRDIFQNFVEYFSLKYIIREKSQEQLSNKKFQRSSATQYF